MVHFVGAGPGATDLITIRGKKLIENADIIIYAGSLVNPGLLDYSKENCKVYDSAKLTLQEVIEIVKKNKDKDIVRLHTGDPSIYGAIREQMDELDRLGISYDSTPGVSSFCAAAASLNLEYTLPGVSQSVIITRMDGRTSVPQKESIEELSSHGATMVFFLSAWDIDTLSKRLIASGMSKDTPCAVCYKASWDDEKKFTGKLCDIADKAKEEGINKTALIIVGDVVEHSEYNKSKLYDPFFTTEYRKGKCD